MVPHSELTLLVGSNGVEIEQQMDLDFQLVEEINLNLMGQAQEELPNLNLAIGPLPAQHPPLQDLGHQDYLPNIPAQQPLLQDLGHQDNLPNIPAPFEPLVFINLLSPMLQGNSSGFDLNQALPQSPGQK